MLLESRSQSCCSLTVVRVDSDSPVLDGLMSIIVTHMLAVGLLRKLTAKGKVEVEEILHLLLPMRFEIREGLDGSTNQHGRLMDLKVSDVVDALREFVVVVDLHVVIVVQLGSDVKMFPIMLAALSRR